MSKIKQVMKTHQSGINYQLPKAYDKIELKFNCNGWLDDKNDGKQISNKIPCTYRH